MPSPPSKTAADRAGGILRRFSSSPRSCDPDDVAEAFRIVRLYRSAHSYPLTKTSVGLRQFIGTEEHRANRRLHIVPPAQRLKRTDAILAKLKREPSMRLSQMEDVAGCRAVLVDRDGVYAVATRVRANWEIDGEDDYINEPKSDGYRALHLRVRRDDRLVEIQLRTRLAHEWAELVDALTISMRPGHDVKHGLAPADLLADLKRLADLLEQAEATPTAVPAEIVSEVAAVLPRIARVGGLQTEMGS